MKKLFSILGYWAAFIGIFINVFLVPEPTNNQVVHTVFYAMVIIVLSIQKDNQENA